MKDKDSYFEDDFLRGYLGACLWAETDDSDDAGGEPLDANYTLSDFSLETVEAAARECAAFQEANAAALEEFYAYYPQSPDGDSKKAFAGHNFWLNRVGHGVGFWCRETGDSDVGERLSKACKAVGERYVYVGDDDQLWIQ